MFTPLHAVETPLITRVVRVATVVLVGDERVALCCPTSATQHVMTNATVATRTTQHVKTLHIREPPH